MNDRPAGKTRNAGAVIIFTLCTLGIYYYVWYYKINNEIRLHDENQKVSPGLAVLALFIPFINLVSLYNTANRIKLMQKADGSTDLISPGAALLWLLFFGIGYPIYLQGALNNHWHEHAVRPRKPESFSREMAAEERDLPLRQSEPQLSLQTPAGAAIESQPEPQSAAFKETSPARPEVTSPVPPQEQIATSYNSPPKQSGASGKLVWVALGVVVLVSFAGYLVFHKKSDRSYAPSASASAPQPVAEPSSNQGQREAARVVAQDALRQGTLLSLSVTKLPKLEKVLQAAKQLGEISPRYQDQITSAESALTAARAEQNECLEKYTGKLLDLLCNYAPDQVSSALDVVKNGDLSPREKKVVDLLVAQLEYANRGSKPDTPIVHADFNKLFTDFVD